MARWKRILALLGIAVLASLLAQLVFRSSETPGPRVTGERSFVLDMGPIVLPVAPTEPASALLPIVRVAVVVEDGRLDESEAEVSIDPQPFTDPGQGVIEGPYDPDTEAWIFSIGEMPSHQEVAIHVNGTGYLSCAVVERLTPGRDLEVRLTPAATVLGSIVDRAGDPVVDARVTLLNPAPVRNRWRHLREALVGRDLTADREITGRTGRDGRFLLDELVPAADYRLRVTTEDFPEQAFWIVLAPGENELPPIVLDPGAELAVRITPALPGDGPFEVVVKTFEDAAWRPEKKGRLEPGSTLLFRGLSCQMKRVMARRFLAGDATLEVAAGAVDRLESAVRHELNLVVDPRSPVPLTVLETGSREPVPMAAVKIMHRVERSFSTPLIHTSEDGDLTVVGFPSGWISLTALPPSGSELESGQMLVNLEGGSERLEMTLDPVATPEPGEPPVRITGRIDPQTELPGGTPVRWLLWEEGRGIRDGSDVRGHQPSTFILAKDLHARYRLHWVAEGLEGCSELFTVSQDQELDVPHVGPAGRVEGRVVNDAGPAHGQVWVFQEGPEPAPRRWRRSRAVARARLGQDGSFVIPDLPTVRARYEVVLVRRTAANRQLEIASFEAGRGLMDLGVIEVK